MKGFYFIAMILILAMIVAGVIINTGPDGIYAYMDLPSLLILLLPVILLLKSQFSWQEMGQAFAIALSKGTVEKEILKKALLFFMALQKYLIWTGLIGFLLGIIALLGNVSEYIAMGMGLSTALLILFYAIILIFTVALPFQFGVKKKLVEAGE